MLGYYQTESIPNPAMSMSAPAIAASLEAINPVKSLVCSPDIAIYAASKCNGTETAGDPASPTMMNGGKYQCLLCQESFAQKKVYQNHLRLHGKDGEDPYRCNICGKTFAVPARLTRHYRTHTGEKPYQCEYCSKSFSVKENLSVHRRIHTKERPYKCNVCGRAFEHSGKLHRHMRIHTGERPHKCTVCAKTFIQSGQLVIHMRTHTGEKPYVCKSCKKGFTCSKQLKVHMRTHTGEKPYTCDICRKAFGYNHVLKLHQVSHYGEKVYKCMICNETFNSKKTMELHIKKHPESPASSVTAGVAGNGLSSPAVLGSLIELDVEISQGGSGDGDGGDGGSGDGNKSSNGDDNRPSLRNNTGTVNVPTTNSSLPGIIADDKENLKTKEAYPDSTTPSPYTVQRELAYYLYSTNREQQQQQYSQTDDKENLKTEEGNPDSTTPIPYTVQREFAYYLYSSNREQQQSQYSQPVTTPPVSTAAEPVLTDVDEKRFQASMVVSAPLESAAAATCHVFFYPEPTYTSFGMATGGGINLDTDDCSSLLNLPGNDARRRVEAALEAVEEECQRQEYNVGIKVDRDPLLTPPGSNPESPLSSPDLALDLAIPSRETLILPLRKRSKMILQSMESEYRNNSLIATSQRQSSVIQFARASVKVL